MIPVLHNNTVVITMIIRMNNIVARMNGARADVKSCSIGVQFIKIDGSVIVICKHNKFEEKVIIMKKLIAAALFTLAIMLSGCASSSEKYNAPYISPTQFQTYSCAELLAEIERIQSRVSHLTGRSDGNEPTNGKLALDADLSLSWAALFALAGTKEQEAEYAQLKSEYDAIQQWAVIKQCSGVIPPAEKPPEFDPDLVERFISNPVAKSARY